jgi:hypothetical protein
MIKDSSKQTGSAHAIIIVILVIALLGTLGFVFWQNFMVENKTINPTITSEDKSAEKTNDEKEVDNTKLYNSETYSFSYPDKGWILKDANEEQQTSPSISTEKFTSEPFRIISGAAVYVHSFPFTSTFEQRVKDDEFSANVFSDISKTKVDGIDADSYTLRYEGVYYITEFVKDNRTYQIRFQVADGEKAQYEDVYKLFVTSFKFK